ncbi:3-oxoacyl-ACP reductase FabG [Streptomyces sp. ME03-5709C]|nr:3-oxoacyl-ACP reductase FabG [Streptomyces sp. ME03-5709C]
MAQRLVGKSALVTGASRGLGAGIVRRLASEGARVAFTYHKSRDKAEALVAEIEASGGRALALQADSADRSAVRASVETTVASSGGLDILVNNAGGAHVAPLDDFPQEEYDWMLEVNVTAVFTAIQAAIPHLGRGGRIINIGSVTGDRIQMAGLAPYAMVKSAVAGLTRAAAFELGPRGITVNTVQPGPTNTDANSESGPYADIVTAMIPVGKYAQPSDIASAVAYLASPEAWFVNGASWKVDGGHAL